jgi:hypothetical protein
LEHFKIPYDAYSFGSSSIWSIFYLLYANSLAHIALEQFSYDAYSLGSYSIGALQNFHMKKLTVYARIALEHFKFTDNAYSFGSYSIGALQNFHMTKLAVYAHIALEHFKFAYDTLFNLCMGLHIFILIV